MGCGSTKECATYTANNRDTITVLSTGAKDQPFHYHTNVKLSDNDEYQMDIMDVVEICNWFILRDTEIPKHFAKQRSAVCVESDDEDDEKHEQMKNMLKLSEVDSYSRTPIGFNHQLPIKRNSSKYGQLSIV